MPPAEVVRGPCKVGAAGCLGNEPSKNSDHDAGDGNGKFLKWKWRTASKPGALKQGDDRFGGVEKNRRAYLTHELTFRLEREFFGMRNTRVPPSTKKKCLVVPPNENLEGLADLYLWYVSNVMHTLYMQCTVQLYCKADPHAASRGALWPLRFIGRRATAVRIAGDVLWGGGESAASQIGPRHHATAG